MRKIVPCLSLLLALLLFPVRAKAWNFSGNTDPNKVEIELYNAEGTITQILSSEFFDSFWSSDVFIATSETQDFKIRAYYGNEGAYFGYGNSGYTFAAGGGWTETVTDGDSRYKITGLTVGKAYRIDIGDNGNTDTKIFMQVREATLYLYANGSDRIGASEAVNGCFIFTQTFAADAYLCLSFNSDATGWGDLGKFNQRYNPSTDVDVPALNVGFGKNKDAGTFKVKAGSYVIHVDWTTMTASVFNKLYLYKMEGSGVQKIGESTNTDGQFEFKQNIGSSAYLFLSLNDNATTWDEMTANNGRFNPAGYDQTIPANDITFKKYEGSGSWLTQTDGGYVINVNWPAMKLSAKSLYLYTNGDPGTTDVRRLCNGYLENGKYVFNTDLRQGQHIFLSTNPNASTWDDLNVGNGRFNPDSKDVDIPITNGQFVNATSGSWGAKYTGRYLITADMGARTLTASSTMYLYRSRSDNASGADWSTIIGSSEGSVNGRYTFTVDLQAGDYIVMSQKANGTGWDDISPLNWSPGTDKDIVEYPVTNFSQTSNGAWYATTAGRYPITVDWNAKTFAAGDAAKVDNPQAPSEAIVVSGNARFTVLTPEMIRIEYSDQGVFEDRATFTIQNRQMESVPNYSTTEDSQYLYISTEKLTLKYRKGTNPKTVPASSKNLTITFNHNGAAATWYPGKPDPLNLKGTCRTLDGCYGDSKRGELENGLISRSGWAVIDDSFTAARPDGSQSYALEYNSELGYDWWTARRDPHALDIYFMGYGNDYKKALGDFTKVAGRIPLPPKYVFGYWYSRYAEYSADDYRQLMSDLKTNNIPTDVMILDMNWHYYGNPNHWGGIGGWTGWSWNEFLIPDPKGLLQDLHNNNFKVSLNLHPADGINSAESQSYFNTMKAQLNGKYLADDSNIAWSIDYPDFARSFFNTIIRDHESEGVDFWWLDWQQYLVSNNTPGLGETFWCNHTFFNDMKTNRRDRRPVIFHRWGGLGSHRYQIGFSGDANISFPSLAFQPYFTATASNVGYTYWGHDLGGHMFSDEATVNNPELVLRWLQFGVFTPIFRSHATNDSRIERRIWKFSNFPQMLEAVRLRYSLFPYLYTMARKTYDTGVGICRPLYYEYPEEENAYKYEGEYFFGDDILVAPIVEPAPDGVNTPKDIWFPEGRWWSASTNEVIEGPCVETLYFKANQIPYFFKEGSVIPYNTPSVMNVTEPMNKIILNVVAGKDGEGSLYEDAGDNSDYATNYATTKFTHTVAGNTETYTIEPRTGNAAGLVGNRAWTLNVMNAPIPNKVTVNGAELNASEYSYNAATRTLSLNINETSCGSRTTVAITYTEVTGIASVSGSKGLNVSYDRTTDSLVADLGESRSDVSLKIFNLSGEECMEKSYSDVSFFNEDLSSLPKAMYICSVKADKQRSINKICK